ncbi:hypothetical protein QE152_g36849 [Popillia japonica]|uniref:Uncharacterized protein n=1 Tax=Popillia japonica TaxID=7064 RepID=A0AAW1IC18_POPJA
MVELQEQYTTFKVTKIESEVYCPVCKTSFGITNKRKPDLEQHLETNKHQQKIRTIESAVKAEAIVTGVLAPHSVESVTAQAKQCNFIDISTDASNHGNFKIFPVLIQFFDKKHGLTVKIIEISNLNDEKSETIVMTATQILDGRKGLVKKMCFQV